MAITTASRWATTDNVTKAGKLAPPAPEQPAEPAGKRAHRLEHRRLILDRRRTRRLPWVAAALAGGWSLLAWGAGAAFSTVGIDPLAVAGVMTSVPALATATLAIQHRRWCAEILAGGAAASGLVVAVGTAGPSWLAGFAGLAAVPVCAYRHWKTQPIGPTVPPLLPEWQPPVVPPPAPRPVIEVDQVVENWAEHNASSKGKAPLSRLTNRRETEYTVKYDIELQPGQQTYRSLLPVAADLAGGLKLRRRKVLFGPPEDPDAGEHIATLAIITKDPTSETRFFTGPRVENGVIKGVARLTDGSGECDVIMWDAVGMVPTMVVGTSGGGKSAAGNVIACGAMSTELLNMMYIDPKGNSSTALARRARVAIIGLDNAMRAGELAMAIATARDALVEVMGDKFRATKQVPGWMLLHDEFSFVATNTKAAQAWRGIVNTVRSKAMWPVAMNQVMQESKWGDEQTRSAFASQVIAFYFASKSSDTLVPGLDTFRPSDLPLKPDGRPVSGYAIHGYAPAPCRWDFLPSDADDELDVEPPYRTSTAFDEFFRQPDVHPIDVAAIEAVLGPAVNGRWVVGGPHATHEFPDLDQADNAPVSRGTRPAAPSAATTPVVSGGGFGLLPVEEVALTEAERTVLDVVNSGKFRTGEIEQAADPLHRTTVGKALASLADVHGLIRRGKRGTWYRTGEPPVREDSD